MIRVQLIGASPDDRARLALDAEFDRIDRSIRLGSLRDRFEVRTSHQTSGAQLVPLLLEAMPAVVHFSGHGNTSEGLIFQHEDGTSQPVSAAALTEIFAGLPSVTCVVLNACYSAAQAVAIADQVEAVIGMSDQVSDLVATGFSEVFYQALAEGHATRAAFDVAAAHVGVLDPIAAAVPTWFGTQSSATTVLAALPQHRGEIARQLYNVEYLRLAQSISALLDDAGCGSVVEEVFGEFVVTVPPVDAGAELRWIEHRVLVVAGERSQAGASTGTTGQASVDKVLAAIRAQPPLEAQMLLHRYYHHHTDAEIAAALGVALETVEPTIAAAMQQVVALVKALG